MSEGILPFRRSGQGGGHGGDGSDAGSRLDRLEEAIGDIKESLKKIEAGQHRLELEVAEMKGALRGLDGEMKGRLQSIEGRFSAMPTSLQLISVVVALVVAAGLFRFFEPRYPAYAPPTQTRPAP